MPASSRLQFLCTTYYKSTLVCSYPLIRALWFFGLCCCSSAAYPTSVFCFWFRDLVAACGSPGVPKIFSPLVLPFRLHHEVPVLTFGRHPSWLLLVSGACCLDLHCLRMFTIAKIPSTRSVLRLSLPCHWHPLSRLTAHQPQRSPCAVQRPLWRF